MSLVIVNVPSSILIPCPKMNRKIGNDLSGKRERKLIIIDHGYICGYNKAIYQEIML